MSRLRFNPFLGCTLAPLGRRPFVITLVLGFLGVVLASLAPVFLKSFIDSISTDAPVNDSALFVALMLSTFFIGSVLYELKWLFYARTDRHNYLEHIKKTIASYPDAAAMRLHRAAQGNGKYIAIISLTLVPIALEAFISSLSILLLGNVLLATCFFVGCTVQMLLVVGRSSVLNPLFSQSREREYTYFHALEKEDQRANLDGAIHSWYDAVSCINSARYRLRMISLIPVVTAMAVANGLALHLGQDVVSVGVIAALNTYFLQVSGKIEMLGNSLREALQSRNLMQMSNG